jgi:hypothetical protein
MTLADGEPRLRQPWDEAWLNAVVGVAGLTVTALILATSTVRGLEIVLMVLNTVVAIFNLCIARYRYKRQQRRIVEAGIARLQGRRPSDTACGPECDICHG